MQKLKSVLISEKKKRLEILVLGSGEKYVEEVFFQRLFGEISAHSIVIDIGANTGAFSLYAACSQNTKVYAYEPFQPAFDLLVQNIHQNGFGKRIFPFLSGVGKSSGKRKLFLSNDSQYHSTKKATKVSVKVKSTTLFGIFKKRKLSHCDLLKMDCEGAEYDILISTPSNLFKKIQNIVYEYHPIKEIDRRKVLIRFLKKKGYCLVRRTKLEKRTEIFFFAKSI